MKIHDISMPLREGMPVYAGNPPFRRPITHELSKGAPCNQSRLEMGAHCGTHLDAPLHFERDGFAVEAIPPENLIGPARVHHFPALGRIDRPDLEKLDWKGVERVLFRTRNSEHWKTATTFDEAYVYLTGPGAEFLVEKKIRLVGTDGLGIEQFGQKTHPAHHALLQAGITIVEGLWLSDVGPGDYWLFCAPLRLQGAEGAPARAFLLDRAPGA
jgi:arylformamidase